MPASGSRPRRRRAAPGAQRRRHRDRQVARSPTSPTSEPGGEPGRHRAVGQPGRDHGAQLDARPMMRAGEVLETVPGVIISQHSGEGKANQYYLRGFNLDHGTDFATTRRRHAGQHADARRTATATPISNFLIPELVSGVQFSKGPYFADQGDFATAGAANINYTNSARPADRAAWAAARMASAARWSRRRRAVGTRHTCSPRSRSATTMVRGTRPDDYRKINGVVRYSRGDAVNGLSLTGMGYRGEWNSTDQVPRARRRAGRASAASARSTRPTAAKPIATAARSSGSGRRGNAATRVTAYGIALRPRTSFRTSRSSSTIPSAAISSAGRSPVRHRREGRAIAASSRWGGRACRTRSACRSGTTTSPTSASTTRRRGSALET